MRRVCTKSVQVTSKQQSHFFYVDHNRSILKPSWPVKHKNKTNKARESNIMFNSSAAGWFWWAAFSSCYPQTQRCQRCWTKTTSNKAQRPAFILLLHCEAFFSPPSFSWSSHKSRVATGSFHRELMWLCGTQPPYTLCSNCCCHQFNCWGVSQPPCPATTRKSYDFHT